MSADIMKLLQNMPARSNRTLEELQNSNDQLSGGDTLELKGWAHANNMIPGRDLKDDPLGQALLAVLKGQLGAVQTYVTSRLSALGGDRAAVAQELYEARWGPPRLPIYNVILIALHMRKQDKPKLLDLTRYLAQDIKVPVDGTDVTGSPTLYYAISCQPFAQPEFAQILFDAGGSVNQKNRFGATAVAEIVQVHPGTEQNNAQMLKWFLQHGGDVEAKDNDGMSGKKVIEIMADPSSGLSAALRAGRGPRQEADCANCGRKPAEGKPFAACAKCKTTRYCSQECQKVDWKTHKKTHK